MGQVPFCLPYSGEMLGHFPSGTNILESRSKSTFSQMPEDYSWEGQQTPNAIPSLPRQESSGPEKGRNLFKTHGVSAQVRTRTPNCNLSYPLPSQWSSMCLADGTDHIPAPRSQTVSPVNMSTPNAGALGG